MSSAPGAAKKKEIKAKAGKKEVAKAEPKKEVAKAEEPKKEVAKAEEPKKEEAKVEEPKKEEAKAEEPKEEVAKAEEAKAEEGKPEEGKPEEAKKDEGEQHGKKAKKSKEPEAAPTGKCWTTDSSHYWDLSRLCIIINSTSYLINHWLSLPSKNMSLVKKHYFYFEKQNDKNSNCWMKKSAKKTTAKPGQWPEQHLFKKFVDRPHEQDSSKYTVFF